jgi:hypothetical protein
VPQRSLAADCDCLASPRHFAITAGNVIVACAGAFFVNPPAAKKKRQEKQEDFDG